MRDPDDRHHDAPVRAGRRAALQGGLAAVAVLVTTTRAHAAARVGSSVRPPVSAPTPARASEGLGTPIAFLGLHPGLVLGAWRVVDVRAHAKAVALVMCAPDGAHYQLDVLGRDGPGRGVAHSAHYSVFLVDGGDGHTPSDEMRARGALAVGHYLRWAETRVATAPRLVTLAERLRDDPRGAFRIV